MKNIYYLLLFSLFLTSCRVNVINMRSDKFSFRTKENEEWSKFSEWQQNNLEIKLRKSFINKIRPRLVIFEKDKKFYTLLDDGVESKTDNGSNVLTFKGKDNDGDNCYVILIEKKDTTNLILYYSNLNLCYNVYEDKK